MVDAEEQLAGFLAAYTPQMARLGADLIAAMRRRLPEAEALVYDNYNALAVGFSPDQRSSNAIVSIALYPRWASLFFLQAAGLPDPQGLLKGSGKTIRHIRIESVADLASAAMASLLEAALASARAPLDPGHRGSLTIKSVSAKQRPRRPATL